MSKIVKSLLAVIAVAALTNSARADYVIDAPDVSVNSGESSTFNVNESITANTTTNLFVTASTIHIKFDPTLLTVTAVNLGGFDITGTDYSLTVNTNALAGGDIVASISLKGGHTAHALTTTPTSFITVDFTAASVASTTNTPINIVLSAQIGSSGGNIATNVFTRASATTGTGANRAFNPPITNGSSDIPDGVVTINVTPVPEPGSIALVVLGGLGVVLGRRRIRRAV